MNSKLQEMAAHIVKMVDADRFALRSINRAIPELSMSLLAKLNLVGRGKYYLKLLNPSTPAEVMLSQMTYEDQVEAFENDGVTPVATLNPDGTPGKVVLLPTLSLTGDQCDQVSFKMPTGVRTWRAQEDQPSWLIDHRTNLATRPSRKLDKTKWVIRNGNITVIGKNPVLAPAEMSAALQAVLNPSPAVDV